MVGIRRALRRIVFGRPRGTRARLWRRARACAGRGPEAPAEAARPPPPPVQAPSGYVDVLGAHELKPGQILEVLVHGRAVAVANVDGRYLAFDAACPHAGGPLADGWLEGTTLTCPLHGWTFDVETGACHVDPAAPLGTWNVRVVDGRVCVRAGA